MNKKVVYVISRSNKLFASIYDDGTADCLSNIHHADGIIKDLLKCGFSNYEIDAPEIALSKTGDMCNRRYQRAFLALCFITMGTPNDDPPFNGFTVEYFGEGKPWERAVPEGAVI